MDLREDTLVHRDIRRYFTVKFEEIRAKDTYLPQDWPGEDVVDQLVDKASGQFIYAATVMPYIMFTYHSPEERLAVIRVLLEKPPGDKPYQNLDELYSHIIRNANRRADMLRIMGLLIIINQLMTTVNPPSGVFARLYSPRTLGDILGLGRGDVRRCLMDMHSVVSVADEDRYLQIYHKSFPDFLLDPSRSKEFAINVEDLRDTLFSCLVVTNSFEHRDTTLRILGQVIIAGLPPDLDTSTPPPNSSSPQWIAGILALDPRIVMEIVTKLLLLLEVGEADEDIRIRHQSFVEFLLDRK